MKNLRKRTAAALVLVLLLTVLPPSLRAAADDEAMAAAQELWSLSLFLGAGRMPGASRTVPWTWR